MSRPDLPTFDVREPYLYLVSQQLTTESGWTLMGQLKTVDPNQTSGETEFKRIGDKNATVRSSAIKTAVTLSVFADHDLTEVARILGTAKPGGGWVGNEKITLDPTKLSNFKIEGYDGTTAAAALVSTEYVIRFKPSSLKPTVDAETNARMYEISGSADDYYGTPASGA